MPKFKLKKILSRLVLGKSRKEEDGMHYLCLGFGRLLSEPHDDNADDGSSIVSYSTTATANDLPGTGRFIDTYIFQSMGRRIERLAMPFTIASLHPARIAQYIEADDTNYFPGLFFRSTLNHAIANLCRNKWNGSTVVAGMKGLVKQTQSISINRSALALAALVRVSLTMYHRELYVNLSRIEPIFHLETLARSSACSYPDKKWYLFLVKLARENLVAVRSPSSELAFDHVLGKEIIQLWPSPETALNFRQRLIRVLRIYRSSGLDSLEETVGEACAICARAISTSIHYRARGDAYMHILETVYFTVTFVLRSIHELADYAKNTANTQIYMVLRTLATWIDAIVLRCLDASNFSQRYDIDKLKANMIFHSLVDVDNDTTCMLLPQSSFLSKHFLHMDTLPRRHREAAVFSDDSLITQGLIEGSIHRTRRLLRSFNELEREVFGIPLETNIPTSQPKIHADPNWFLIDDFGDEWWESWKKALEQARRVQVPDNFVTEEFREARQIGLEPDPLRNLLHDARWEVKYDKRNWCYYQIRRASRYKWGQYLRSNMDWDWDLGSCMKRLFKVEQTQEGPSPVAHNPPTASPTIDMGAAPGETWKISAGQERGVLPKEVQIAYEAENGEARYMSFVPALPSPGCRSSSVTANAKTFAEDEVHPKSDSRHVKGSSGGEQEIENLRDASQPEGCGEFLGGISEDDCEGKERAYHVGFDEVRVGGDAISICSLD